MGNYKFRLSDMIPNAWFHKLQDMSRKGSRGNHKNLQAQVTPRGRSHHSPRSSFSSSSYSYNSSYSSFTSTTTSSRTPSKPFSPPQPKLLPNRASYYVSGRSPPPKPKPSDSHSPIEPPRMSKKRSRRKPTARPPPSSAVATACGCNEWNAEPFADVVTASATDIIIDIPTTTTTTITEAKNPPEKHSSSAAELELPPILTKTAKREADYDNAATPKFKKSSPSPRFHLRAASSPRLASKRVQAAIGGRRSTSDAPKDAHGGSSSPAPLAAGKSRKMSMRRGRLPGSVAVVKASADPQRDFRESMLEMIVENGICTAKELEDLLACYLTLNTNEYHDLIVKVFEQIWLDLTTNLKLAVNK